MICSWKGTKSRLSDSGSVGVVECWSNGLELKKESLESKICLRDFSLGTHVTSILEDLFSNTPLLHHSITPC